MCEFLLQISKAGAIHIVVAKIFPSTPSIYEKQRKIREVTHWLCKYSGLKRQLNIPKPQRK